jgi:hypothetical protein
MSRDDCRNTRPAHGGVRYGILRFYNLEWDDDRDDSEFGE